MNTPGPGGRRIHSSWFSVVFWFTIAVCLYMELSISGWWYWVLLAVIGIVATYFWWTRKLASRWKFAFAGILVVLVLGTVAATAALLLRDNQVWVDSSQVNVLDCGSVWRPVPVEELQVTSNETGEPAVLDRPIPGSDFERVCSNQIRYRVGDVPGLVIIGALLALRAAGHVHPSRRPHPVRNA